MLSTFRDPFVGFDNNSQQSKSKKMENEIPFDIDKNADFMDLLDSLNFESSPTIAETKIDEFSNNNVSFLDEYLENAADVMLSDAALNRQISRDIELRNNKNQELDDDSNSSSDEMNVLTKTAQEYEHSYPQNPTNAAVKFDLNAEQKEKFRQYFSSKPTRNNADSTFVDHQEIVRGGRRPKNSDSPVSSSTEHSLNKSRGALYAKQYRQKNKVFVDKMQNELDRLNEENKDLKETCGEMRERMSSLQDEVVYLRNILANDSQLSVLLKSVTNTPGIKFRFPVGQQENNNSKGESSSSAETQQRYATRKRKQANSAAVSMEEIPPPSKKMAATSSSSLQKMPGVCLHVNGDTVSLEFCARCSTDARCD